MLSTNSNNYERIIISEKEFQRRYDKHSVYNPENCCEANLINCCEARALETSNNKIATSKPESPESPETNKIESSKQEIEANISWVRQCLGYNVDSEEALEKYNIYKNYREEGQTIEVSKQYAGLL